MKMARNHMLTHLTILGGLGAALVLCVVYPFLPGRYDGLAVPLSTMVQVFGVVGLPLVVVGLFWLIVPRCAFRCAMASIVLGTGVALILALFATLSVGPAFGALTLAAWASLGLRLIPRLRALRQREAGGFQPAPLYLIALPVLSVVAQLGLAAPLTRWSRERAMANAAEFINDIEHYHTRHGRYPISLQALHKDYDPAVVGVDRFSYAPQGDAYHLFFEQPRFLLDRLGTREWVVYNSRDEHRAYSHVAWLLLPTDGREPMQGWYASGDAGREHWKYFWFD